MIVVELTAPAELDCSIKIEGADFFNFSIGSNEAQV